MKERRKFTRFDKKLGVLYATLGLASVEGSSQTVNVSKGGLRLPISRLIKKGDRLRLQIDSPDRKYPPIQAIGKIVWSREASGFELDSGVQFVRISPYDASRLIT